MFSRTKINIVNTKLEPTHTGIWSQETALIAKPIKWELRLMMVLLLILIEKYIYIFISRIRGDEIKRHEEPPPRFLFKRLRSILLRMLYFLFQAVRVHFVHFETPW